MLRLLESQQHIDIVRLNLDRPIAHQDIPICALRLLQAIEGHSQRHKKHVRKAVHAGKICPHM